MASCTEISFTEPQPKGIKKLKSFPPSLRGKYSMPDDSTSANPDTLLVSQYWYRIGAGQGKVDWLTNGTLSDSLVLKSYKGYYFLNFLVEKQWVIRTFKQEKNGNIILLDVTLSDDLTMKKLKEKLHPETIKVNSSTFYKVDPLPDELLEFIRENYTAQQTLQKIN